jgi:hypothetical protein
MNRRHFVATAPALFAAAAWAHHGWSSFDESQPIFLEGRVKSVKWQNPHAEIVLEASYKPMPDLARALEYPKQQANVDATAIFAKARPPAKGKSNLWEVEFAPIARMQAWNLSEPKVGDSVAVVGYALRSGADMATLRVEFWILGGKAIPLRSSPA